jgi:endo-1,4-beta-xylanase
MSASRAAPAGLGDHRGNGSVEMVFDMPIDEHPFNEERRSVLKGFASAAMGTLAGLLPGGPSIAQVTAAASPSERTIKSAAQRACLTIGSAVLSERDDLPSKRYTDILTREFQLATPGLTFKISRIARSPTDLNFVNSDYSYDTLKALGLGVRGHTILWHDYLPDFIKRMSADEAKNFFYFYIDQLAGRYAGRLDSWDVVNEPTYFWKGNVSGLRDGPFLNAFGDKYIELAFKRVRAIDPSTKLVLNEAFSERGDAVGRFTRVRLLQLIDRLLDAGAPVQAIGLQAHLQPQHGVAYEEFAAFAQAIADRGLDIYLTELDVDDTIFPSNPAARDEAVAQVYEKFLTVALANGRIRQVIFWGFFDKNTSVPNKASLLDRDLKPRPLLYDENFVAKPAREAVIRALEHVAPLRTAQPCAAEPVRRLKP